MLVGFYFYKNIIMKITPKMALDLCQRNLDKWYINDPYWSGEYRDWYTSCLKDMAILLLWDDSEYWRE